MFLVMGVAFVALSVLAIRSSRSGRRGALPAVLGYSGLFFLAIQAAWATLMFTSVVRLDGVGRWFGVYDVLPRYGYLAWIPPLLATFVFAICSGAGSRPVEISEGPESVF